MSRPAGYDDQVRAWAAALRARDTRTWAEFRASSSAPIGVGLVPGIAQLELVRRLAAREIAGDFAALADLVFSTASPGRGLVDPPLPWPDSDGFGTPALEPDQQPPEELVRAASAVLARLLIEQSPTVPPVPRTRWTPWRKRFVLAGAPVAVRAMREALLSAGLREGGRRATYLVLGGSLDDLMAQHWTTRIEAGAAMRWRRMWRVAANRDRLPDGIDLPAVAERFAASAGPARVHVILEEDPTARVAELLGVRLDTETVQADVVAADLLRELNPLLVLAAGEAGRDAVVAGGWAAALAAQQRQPRELRVPIAFASWADRTAAAMAERLAVGDYAVHGDPGLLSRHRQAPRSVPVTEVLDLALDLIAASWKG